MADAVPSSKGTCSNVTCGAGKVQKQNSSSIVCNNVCTPSDCCTGTAPKIIALPPHILITVNPLKDICACACNAQTVAPVNCDAKWTSSNCTKACDGGSRNEKYVIKTASAGTGKTCDANNGTTRTFACNTQKCGDYLFTIPAPSPG